jgi:FAD dependent oxidoreductase
MGFKSAAIRVVVLGGGILGVSTAHHLARRGAAVTLVSDTALASGASGRSRARLNSWAIRPSEYHRLRMLGIDRYRALDCDRRAAPIAGFVPSQQVLRAASHNALRHLRGADTAVRAGHKDPVGRLLTGPIGRVTTYGNDAAGDVTAMSYSEDLLPNVTLRLRPRRATGVDDRRQRRHALDIRRLRRGRHP